MLSYGYDLIVEEYLTGREFTVGLIGEGEVIGIMEINYKNKNILNIYSYSVKQNYKDLVYYTLLEEGKLYDKCKSIAITAFKELDCKDIARVDIRLNKCGEPVFIEINSLPGLNPEDSDLIILSKLKRVEYKEVINKIIERL